MTEQSISKPKRICKVKKCKQEHHAKGYCKKHYWQYRRHGKILKRTRFDPNEFIIEGDICRIKLYDRYGNEKDEAIIDAEDYDKVKNMKWCIDKLGRIQSSRKYLHHIIMDFKFKNHEREIDHINGNRKYNRKINLRECNSSQNQCNRGKQKNNTSGLKGVYWRKNRKKWLAQIGINRKYFNLGYYNSRREAAYIYNEAALKYHGEFAQLNQIF